MRLTFVCLVLLGCSEYSYQEKAQVPPPGDTAAADSPPASDETLEPSIENQPENGSPELEPEPSNEEPSQEPSEEEEEDIPDEGFDPDLTLPFLEPDGNVVTILMTLSDLWIPPETASQLIQNAVRFASNVESPRVLVIRDDNHNGEDIEDSTNIVDWINQSGGNASFMEEPANGISNSDLSGYHVVILSNPGFPPDDITTIEVMREFSKQGYGIIFQGDDMTRLTDPLMVELTRLNNIDNGTNYYGTMIDNDQGETYEVTMVSASVLSAGIGNIQFQYGNDIDTAEPTVEGMSVAAWCTVPNTSHPSKPVITAFSPQQSPIE